MSTSFADEVGELPQFFESNHIYQHFLPPNFASYIMVNPDFP